MIIIEKNIGKNFDGTFYETGSFNVSFDGKTAVGVGYDEMLGLISAIAMPEHRPCLQWLKTPEENKKWDEKYNK